MKRPLAVTAIGGLFIVTGIASVIYHATEGPVNRWTFVISLVGLTALAGGAFLLQGKNWARWLVLGWLAFHVGVSAFASMSKLLPHIALLLVIGYILLRPPASEYFRGEALSRSGET